MSDDGFLVIGAGPAGLSAAIEIARAGLPVEMIEQRSSIGGAIYRQPIEGVTPVPQSSVAKARWRALSDAVRREPISIRHHATFLGVDGNGMALIEDRQSGAVIERKAQAVIIATGAVEKVLPRHGWQLAGVSTAGGLQVMMKETGHPPRGRVLLAGSGPLLIAVAAQMARLGNPPVAIVEAGDPVRRVSAGLRLLAFPALVREAASYVRDVMAHKVPWLRGAALIAIEDAGAGLVATVRDHRGATRRFTVDRIGLHDGIHPNNFGLPHDNTTIAAAPLILRAGDCREALGAVAAEADGTRMARHAIDILAGKSRGNADRDIARQYQAQQVLRKVFAPLDGSPGLALMPDETVLCRCENRTIGDLKSLCATAEGISGREVKHNGRFAMGACQGRFCAANTATLMAELRPDLPPPAVEDLTGRRWPIRPVSIDALSRAASQNLQDDKKD